MLAPASVVAVILVCLVYGGAGLLGVALSLISGVVCDVVHAGMRFWRSVRGVW